MSNKVRKTIQLDPKQAKMVRKEAYKKNVSESEIVRQALGLYRGSIDKIIVPSKEGGSKVKSLKDYPRLVKKIKVI